MFYGLMQGQTLQSKKEWPWLFIKMVLRIIYLHEIHVLPVINKTNGELQTIWNLNLNLSIETEIAQKYAVCRDKDN